MEEEEEEWIEIQNILEKSKKEIKLSGKVMDEKIFLRKGKLPFNLWNLIHLNKVIKLFYIKNIYSSYS